MVSEDILHTFFVRLQLFVQSLLEEPGTQCNQMNFRRHIFGPFLSSKLGRGTGFSLKQDYHPECKYDKAI